MNRIAKLKGLFACLVALIVVAILTLKFLSFKENARQRVELDLRLEIAGLKNENDRLIRRNRNLSDQIMTLKTYLDAYEQNFIDLKDSARDCSRTDSILAAEPTPEIVDESAENRRILRVMMAEKDRWDQFQQGQYRQILDGTIEPTVYEVQRLDFANEANREIFIELADALKLHRRLIRDVRLFHDEIQYQQRQQQAQRDYELFDLKFKLAPFARESALVDALQQAMSALSAGIYQAEAVAVLDRIGREFTEPIRQLTEQQDADIDLTPAKYIFNLYALYGQKLMSYSDSLARQTSIPLGPSVFGELDFFSRELSDRFYDLYLVGQTGKLQSAGLNLDELAEVINFN